MVFRLYNLLFPLVFVLLLPGYLRRMVRRGNHRRHFGQRLGLYSAEERARWRGEAPPVWVQAVSVGEMLVALKLIAALRERRPGLPLVVSTTTTTGFQLARERVPEGVSVVYTPVDLRFAVRRAFDALRPAGMIIVDGGLWPNQLLEARRRGIPVTLANARLSPRSERRFRRFRFVARSLFALLDRVAVPEAGDVARWEDLGVARERITVTGSIKYDDARPAGAAPPATDSQRDALRRAGLKAGVPILLGGSTHPGEERLLAEVFCALRGRFPDLLLIIAPRHVERAGEVLRDLEPLGLRVALRTGGGARTDDPPPDVFLLDTTGELDAWYPLATVVFVGKSLASAAVGGQNPAEAIAAGKPVVFGPHMENFESLAARLLASRAAVQVRDAGDLEERVSLLLANPEECRQRADRARRLLSTHRGAARRTAGLLLS